MGRRESRHINATWQDTHVHKQRNHMHTCSTALYEAAWDALCSAAMGAAMGAAMAAGAVGALSRAPGEEAERPPHFLPSLKRTCCRTADTGTRHTTGRWQKGRLGAKERVSGTSVQSWSWRC